MPPLSNVNRSSDIVRLGKRAGIRIFNRAAHMDGKRGPGHYDAAAFTGSRTTTRVPPSGGLSTEIEPRCRLTIS